MNTKQVQQALIKLGYDLGPGKVDGLIGTYTREAVKSFQNAFGVVVKWPGTIGPKTIEALRRALSDDPKPYLPSDQSLPWMEQAKALWGTTEIPGRKSNPVIMGWAKKLGGWIASYYNNDDIPWCGLFVGHVMSTVLPKEPLPSNPLGAREWAKYGSKTQPTYGAIMVFTRNGGGHVGWYVGEDVDAYHILGGNQSNTVNVTRVAKERFLEARWPKGYEKPAWSKVVKLSASTKLSVNEA